MKLRKCSSNILSSILSFIFFFSSRRRHTRCLSDWSSDVCSSDLLNTLLRDLVASDSRCPLDPGCARAGGACMACLHLGEPSCRYYNQYLNRTVLDRKSVV